MIAALLLCATACGPTTGATHQADLRMDPNADLDGDGFTPNSGDCNDNDPTIHPGAPELCDGKDHDCDGIIDGTCDDDQDGFAVKPNPDRKLPGGDCNDHDPLIGPGAIEIAGDHVDNNCDGHIDEAIPPCDGALKRGDPASMAAAMELCPPWLAAAKMNPDANAAQWDTRTKYGVLSPHQGKSFTAMSTGIVADKGDPQFVEPQPGSAFMGADANPLPMNTNNNICHASSTDPQEVYDYAELTLTLKVPTNVKSFSFDFQFLSSEYPEFVGSSYNDKFLAILDSKAYKGNISFDAKKNPITVNVGFFLVCDANEAICMGSMPGLCTKPVTGLMGTGYEDVEPMSGQVLGGGTGWLTTTAPVVPGETATLRFVIFDEGDHVLDSAVLIDNFQWHPMAEKDPMTIM